MQNPFNSEWQWLKVHEGLIVILAVLVASLIAHYKLVNYLSERDKHRDDAANQVLQVQVAANQQLASRSQQDAETYKQLFLQIAPQIQQLQSEIQRRNMVVQTQQKTDAGLQPDQLASRLMTLAPGGTVVVTPDNFYKLDHPEAVTVTQKLELVEPLQQTVSDQLQIIAGTNKLNSALNVSVADLNKQVNGLNVQLVDKDKACLLDTKVAVDAERKKQRKWYAVFYIAGLATKAVLLGRF
jgi:hypothetical protein